MDISLKEIQILEVALLSLFSCLLTAAIGIGPAQPAEPPVDAGHLLCQCQGDSGQSILY